MDIKARPGPCNETGKNIYTLTVVEIRKRNYCYERVVHKELREEAPCGNKCLAESRKKSNVGRNL